MTYKGEPCYPVWLDNLADGVTLEGAAMEGTAQGAETVRSIIVAAREVYEKQEFKFAGPYGENGFLELYTTPIRGKWTGVVVTVTRNAAGRTQHVIVKTRETSAPQTLGKV